MSGSSNLNNRDYLVDAIESLKADIDWHKEKIGLFCVAGGLAITAATLFAGYKQMRPSPLTENISMAIPALVGAAGVGSILYGLSLRGKQKEKNYFRTTELDAIVSDYNVGLKPGQEASQIPSLSKYGINAHDFQ